MQLDCKRHWISGVRSDSTCRKCARIQENPKPVDKVVSEVHLRARPRSPEAKAQLAQPVASTKSNDGLKEWVKLPPPLEPSRRPSDATCSRCGGDGRVLVLALRWCEQCGLVASFCVPSAPLTGFGFVLAVCALAQWMRERKDGAWIRKEGA